MKTTKMIFKKECESINLKRLVQLLAIGVAALTILPSADAQNVSRSKSDKIIVYPAPVGEVTSIDYHLQINNRPVDVLTTRIGERWQGEPDALGDTYSFIQFDFTGLTEIRINAPGRSLSKVIIQPQSKGIRPKLIDDNTIVITISEPCKLSVEPDGRKRPLIIFANAPEQIKPQKRDTSVLYFGPGIHRPESGIIVLKSNQTLYLDGGAILESTIRMENAENVTICGRGVLSGNRWKWREGPGNMINIVNSKNIKIEGIIVRGSPHWTIVPTGSKDVTISNVKICNSGVLWNDDGINPVNSSNITVRDCFIRTADDCMAFKGIDQKLGNTENIVVENSILWTDHARVVLMGHESRAPRMGDIKFQNLEIIHHGIFPVFLLEPGEDMLLENIQFENIHINGDPPAHITVKNRIWMAVIRPYITRFNKKMTWGRINNISFKNVTLDGGKYLYSILVEGAGDSEDLRIRNISFENVNLQGELLTAKSSLVILGPWASWGNIVNFH
jgi:hypothetical protein